jgi:3-dehydroquinate synthase
MPTLNVDLGDRSYPIYIETGLFNHAGFLVSEITTKKAVVVSNETVAPLYAKTITTALTDAQLNVDLIELPDGEKYKTLDTFSHIQTRLIELGCSRDTTIIALGGGVIGDMAGFSAACFQRGIPFIQVPTTLLSQVDSSVGGKTGVNHPLGKNMIGAFYQPKAVYIDTNSLSTLSEREFNAGMAEVIKYGIMYDLGLFEWLENNASTIKARDPDALRHIIYECCKIKAEVVKLDERENGVRALLNLGHTFGHAIEAEKGYGVWLHGEAVAAGMVLAAKLANMREWLDASKFGRVQELISYFQLPVSGPAEMDANAYIKHMKRDKKVLDSTMRFILPSDIGKAGVYDDVTSDELTQLLG